MKTLVDDVSRKLMQRNAETLLGLLKTYEGEKELAKSYSTFAYLSCAAAGGVRGLAEAMAKAIEAFYLSTSIHDDLVDTRDVALETVQKNFSANTIMVLGDCFFAEMALQLALATPLMAEDCRQITLRKLDSYLMTVAESQVIDEQMHDRIPSVERAIAQMQRRGGTWGRLAMEVPALAGGLAEDDAGILGRAGEDLFMAMTIRDDLQDLKDDMRNGIFTLAVAYVRKLFPDRLPPSSDLRAVAEREAMMGMLYEEGAIESALTRGREYADAALQTMTTLVDRQEDTNWYLLLMIFRTMRQFFFELTPEMVRQGRLGTGLAGGTSGGFEKHGGSADTEDGDGRAEEAC